MTTPNSLPPAACATPSTSVAVEAAAAPTVLAIATEGDDSSVALVAGGRNLVRRAGAGPAGEARWVERSTSRLPELVAGVLDDAGIGAAQIDRFAVDVGPGPFTALRVAMSVCQGLAWGAGRPVVAVDHLHAMAWVAAARWRSGQPERLERSEQPEQPERLERSEQPEQPEPPGRSAHVAVVCDARMDECWIGTYRVADGAWPEPVDVARRVMLDEAGAWLVRPAVPLDAVGWSGRLPDTVRALLPPEPVRIDAAVLAAMALHAGAARCIEASRLKPVYLRDKIALDVDEQRALRAARDATARDVARRDAAIWTASARDASVRDAAPRDVTARDPAADGAR